MQKEIVMIMDFRYDEGVRPRKELICPCITTRYEGGGSSLSGCPLVVERWIKSESDKLQNKDISNV